MTPQSMERSFGFTGRKAGVQGGLMLIIRSAAIAAAILGVPVLAQTTSPTPPPIAPAGPLSGVVLPPNTVVPLVSADEISSINMKVGDTHQIQVASDVVEKGQVVIPRGSPVAAVVTYRTGKGIVGKSAKFEMTFSTVTVNGRAYKLKGKVRQEGRGNTAGALLGSMIITGKSAVVMPGQTMTAITDEPIPAA